MKIKCPACGKVLAIPEAAAGKVVKCPCGKQLRAPGGAAKTASKPQQRPAAKRAATPAPQQARPTPARPTAQRPPAQPAPSSDSLFDDLTDQDLQPVKSVRTPGEKISTDSNPYKTLKKYVDDDASFQATKRGNFEIASISRRIVAFLIDRVLLMGFAVGAVIIGMVLGVEAPETDAIGPIHFLAWGGALVLAFINGFIVAFTGQSIGKMCLGIKIVNYESGKQSGFVDGFLVRDLVFGLLRMLPFVELIDTIKLFSDDDHRTLHDQLAGTAVAYKR